MVELTIRVSNDVARRLEPIRDRLPELLAQIAEAQLSHLPSADSSPGVIRSADVASAYAEVINFLVTSPTPQEIVTFKISPEAQARLRTLLDRNREGTLTDAEQAELDLYEQIEHMMILLKARAHASLA
jgi:hypothetical protein